MPDSISLRFSRPRVWRARLPANPVKRAFDLAIGSLLLLVFMPALLVIAISILFTGPGPVIFAQTRVGAGGRDFSVFKFRTMRADPRLGPAAPFRQCTANDPRVTRLGRLLRRNSLDELPQLLNVIKGEMSLVGPRPHAPETTVEGAYFHDAVTSYRRRHCVKPGMTGLAQIRGQRGETATMAALEQRLASDLEYIESWSLSLDVLILCQTMSAVLSQRNAC